MKRSSTFSSHILLQYYFNELDLGSRRFVEHRLLGQDELTQRLIEKRAALDAIRANVGYVQPDDACMQSILDHLHRD
jgi:hypothetical protein